MKVIAYLVYERSPFTGRGWAIYQCMASDTLSVRSETDVPHGQVQRSEL